MQGGIIHCLCGLEAKDQLVKKDGPNHGRQFFACPKKQGDPSKCNFFRWFIPEVEVIDCFPMSQKRARTPPSSPFVQDIVEEENSQKTPKLHKVTIDDKAVIYVSEERLNKFIFDY